MAVRANVGRGPHQDPGSRQLAAARKDVANLEHELAGHTRAEWAEDCQKRLDAARARVAELEA
jgi:hypothetical protein